MISTAIYNVTKRTLVIWLAKWRNLGGRCDLKTFWAVESQAEPAWALGLSAAFGMSGRFAPAAGVTGDLASERKLIADMLIGAAVATHLPPCTVLGRCSQLFSL